MEKASYDMYVEALTQVSVLIMSSRIFTDREENSLSRKLRENLLEVFAGKAYNMNRKLRNPWKWQSPGADRPFPCRMPGQ